MEIEVNFKKTGPKKQANRNCQYPESQEERTARFARDAIDFIFRLIKIIRSAAVFLLVFSS